MTDSYMDSIMAKGTKLNWKPMKTFFLEDEIICAGVFPLDDLIDLIRGDAKTTETLFVLYTVILKY